MAALCLCGPEDIRLSLVLSNTFVGYESLAITPACQLVTAKGQDETAVPLSGQQGLKTQKGRIHNDKKH
jgi:hypothetical protein